MKSGNLAVVMLLLISVTTIQPAAQVSAFQVAVPFPFVVGTQTLPAGSYVVQRYLGKPKRAEDTGVIVIKADKRHIYEVILTGSGEAPRAARADASRLIFTRFNGKQYLNWVCIAGDGIAHQLKNIPEEIAAQAETEEVIVTGLQYSRRR